MAATAQEQSLPVPVVIAVIGAEQAQRERGEAARPVSRPVVAPVATSANSGQPIRIASLSVPVVVASIGTGQARGGDIVKPADTGSLKPVQAPGVSASVVAAPSVQSTDFGLLELVQASSLSTPGTGALSCPPTDFGPLVLAWSSSPSVPVPVLGTLAAIREDLGSSRPAPMPVLVASADDGADFRLLRSAPAAAPKPTPGPSSAPVVVASTAAPKAGRGESALISAAPLPAQAPGNTDPLIFAQAPAAAPEPTPGPSSAPVVVASTAAPRAGRGESALIGDALPPGQVPGNTGALILADAPVRPLGGEPQSAERGANAAADDWTAALKKGSGPWVIPPVRWSGELVADLQVTGAQGQPRQTQLVESANFKGSSYIWQPWLAQVGGELTLITSQRSMSGGAEGAVATTGINSTNLTGTGTLSLVPASRFPFTASFTASDSRTSGELVSNPLTRRSYSLAQRYSPLQGGANYSLTYNRNDIISAAFGTDRANALGATMRWSAGPNTLSVTGNAYTNSAGNSGNTSANNAIVANHSYRPGAELTVESLVNYNSNQYNVNITNSGTPLDLRFRYLQINSNATWRPTASPLTVTGGASFFQNGTNLDGVAAESRTFSANATALYKLSDNTTVNGSGGVTHASSGARSNVYTNQTVGIAHTSDTIKFGEYSYNWNSGANLGNQTGAESSSRNADAQIGHRLSRNIAFEKDSNLSLDANQNYSILRNTQFAASQSLLHSASAIWSKKLTESTTTLLNVTASDSRTTGYTDQHYQVGTVQGSGQMAINSYSAVSANVAFRASRQAMTSAFPTGAEATPAGGFDTSVSGSLTYQHSRAFGVPRLRYYALMNVTDQNSRTRLQGDINAPVERTNWDFEQRLDYDIGRMSMRLTLRLAEFGGRMNGMLYFRVMRSFGGL